MRVKYTGSGRSRGGGARMSLIKGGYTYYYSSDTATATIQQWPNGVLAEWEINDGQPDFLYLTPATGGGLLLKKGITGRPHISLSTRQLGDLEPAPLQTVEETVTPTEIKIRFPFKLRRGDQAAE
jgi:hypothetical protein